MGEALYECQMCGGDGLGHGKTDDAMDCDGCVGAGKVGGWCYRCKLAVPDTEGVFRHEGVGYTISVCGSCYGELATPDDPPLAEALLYPLDAFDPIATLEDALDMASKPAPSSSPEQVIGLHVEVALADLKGYGLEPDQWASATVSATLSMLSHLVRVTVNDDEKAVLLDTAQDANGGLSASLTAMALTMLADEHGVAGDTPPTGLIPWVGGVGDAVPALSWHLVGKKPGWVGLAGRLHKVSTDVPGAKAWWHPDSRRLAVLAGGKMEIAKVHHKTGLGSLIALAAAKASLMVKVGSWSGNSGPLSHSCVECGTMIKTNATSCGSCTAKHAQPVKPAVKHRPRLHRSLDTVDGWIVSKAVSQMADDGGEWRLLCMDCGGVVVRGWQDMDEDDMLLDMVGAATGATAVGVCPSCVELGAWFAGPLKHGLISDAANEVRRSAITEAATEWSGSAVYDMVIEAAGRLSKAGSGSPADAVRAIALILGLDVRPVLDHAGAHIQESL